MAGAYANDDEDDAAQDIQVNVELKTLPNIDRRNGVMNSSAQQILTNATSLTRFRKNDPRIDRDLGDALKNRVSITALPSAFGKDGKNLGGHHNSVAMLAKNA